MLIAADSWPYIRGTLSPSPPGGPSGPGPQVVYPHVTPLFSYDDDGPTVPSDHHSPLGQTPHFPSPTNTRAAKKRSSPSSTNGFRSLPPSSSARARDAWLLSFSSRRISSSVPWLCALVLYDTFSEERRTYTIVNVVNSPWCRKLPTGHRSCPRAFPVRVNTQINPVRENSSVRT